MTAAATPTMAMDEQLDARGWAVIPGLLTPEQADALTALYDREDASIFRKRVVMQRHGYGQGEYRYFAYPLPDPVQARCARSSTRSSRPSPTAGTSGCAARCASPRSTPSCSRAATRPAR